MQCIGSLATTVTTPNLHKPLMTLFTHHFMHTFVTLELVTATSEETHYGLFINEDFLFRGVLDPPSPLCHQKSFFAVPLSIYEIINRQSLPTKYILQKMARPLAGFFQVLEVPFGPLTKLTQNSL